MDAIYVKLIGRMGNNMFQLAAGASLAYRMGVDCYAYPDPNYWAPEPDKCFLPEYIAKYKHTLFRNFKFIDKLPDSFLVCQEMDFAYHSLPHEKNMCLAGYFQSERYFHKPLIRELFKVDEHLKDKLIKRYQTLLAHKPASINVRRGDYLNVCDHHPVQPLSYFKDAIEIIGSNRHYLITSDDTKWCKENFIGDNFHVIEDITPVENLYLQSLCYDHIISNSTFSWWGAWLDNKRKKQVICPKLWFGPKLSHLNTKDLIPKGWLTI